MFAHLVLLSCTAAPSESACISLLSGHWTLTGQETIWKPASYPRWHSFLWILDIVMTCDYNLNNRGANESGVYSDIPFISSLSCAHACVPQLYFQATSVLIMESLTLMAFDLCDFYVISFYYLRLERRSCACLSAAVCAFKNKRRKHHHDSTKNCVCARVCTCVCAFVPLVCKTLLPQKSLS